MARELIAAAKSSGAHVVKFKFSKLKILLVNPLGVRDTIASQFRTDFSEFEALKTIVRG